MARQKRRQYGSGSVMQRHEARIGCPDPVEVVGDNGKVRKVRPDHSCKGIWIGRVTTDGPDGERRRIVVTGRTEAECARKVTVKAQEVALALAPPPSISAKTTVKAWALEWLDRRRDEVRPKSYANDASFTNKWIVPTIGRRRLADLTPADVRALRDAIVAGGNTTTTALGAHQTLMTMLKDARGEGHRIADRVMEAKRPKKSRSDRQDISVEDTLRILAAAAEDREWRTRWIVALLQGIRQGEALGLTWDCVDFDAGMIDISWQKQDLKYVDRADKTKGFIKPADYEVRHLVGATHLTRPKTSSGERGIPLVPFMQEALWQERVAWVPNPWGLVWTSRDRRNGQVRVIPVRPEQDRDRWHELQERVGVAHPSGRAYHVHEMRHTTATILLELEVPAAVVEAILGHSALVKAYQHVRSGPTRKALQGVADVLQLAPAKAIGA